jgi:hypothetical protein
MDSPGDTTKATAVFYHKLANDPNPPLLLVLGKDAVATVKGKLASLSTEVEKYEEWSENLTFAD